ncbi:MAG TPA: hypothetical protein VMB79_09730 [Jatrophihabitans sp.]|nr:hypothetical protein [Jatrophihabitans sp.]
MGYPIRVTADGRLALAGRLDRVHPEWLLLSEQGGREAIVRVDAVLAVGGVPRLSAAPETMSVVDARIGFCLALRGVARDRSNVQVHLRDGGVLAGTVDRVGADFLELAVHPGGEARRRTEVQDMLVLPVHAVVAVRRQL